MSTIIAGRFQEQIEVQSAIEKLQNAGFPADKISSFFVNPAGQHDLYPIGGDHALSPGAKESDTGVAAGAIAGGVIGAATAPILGPVGPVTGGLLGAHVGGLVGSLSRMKEKGEAENTSSDAADEVDNTEPVRKSGMLVAVSVNDDDRRNQAIELFRSLGAADLESAEGTIEDGDWNDFDPIAPPRFVKAHAQVGQSKF